MNEHEARRWNRTAEEWAKKIKDTAERAQKSQGIVAQTCVNALTIEELLGREVRDAILDDVVP